MEIVLIPGPKDGGGRLSFSPRQLSFIQSTCNKMEFAVESLETLQPKSLYYLSKPGMKTDELWQKAFSLIFTPKSRQTNGSASSFIRLTPTEILNQVLHGHGNNVETTEWLTNELVKANWSLLTWNLQLL